MPSTVLERVKAAHEDAYRAFTLVTLGSSLTMYVVNLAVYSVLNIGKHPLGYHFWFLISCPYSL